MEVYHLEWLDYVTFAFVIFLAAFIGIYLGYIKPMMKRRREPQAAKPAEDVKVKHRFALGSKKVREYLLGSRDLHVFPIAMSLAGSYISGWTIVGTPTEVYVYGTEYWLILLPIVLMGFTVVYVYLPVFAALRLASSYEYLELRFSATIRTIISCMFVMDELFYLPIVIYVPALSFSQATGFDAIKVGCIATVLCILYTYMGGIRTVVATDAFQITVMFISTCIICVAGIFLGGGLRNIFQRVDEDERLTYGTFDPSLYARNTVFSLMVGGYSYWISFNAVNQTMIQRYMCLSDLASMRKAVIIFAAVTFFAVFVCIMCGVLIISEFGRCDPQIAGQIEKRDQIVILYVTKVFQGKYGLAGFFLAGVFGSGLTSLSIVLNSTATVIFQDICKGGFNMEFSERSGTIFLKATVVILGGIALALLPVVSRVGTILAATVCLTSVAASTSFGVFTLGMLVPFANTEGAIAGVVSTALFTLWIALGTQAMNIADKLVPPGLPFFTDGCSNGTVLNFPPPEYDQSKIFPLYRLSYWWVNPIGVVTCLVVGTIVSAFTGYTKMIDVDPQLISPAIHWMLPQECFLNYGAKKQSSKSISASQPSTIHWVGRPPPTTATRAFKSTDEGRP